MINQILGFRRELKICAICLICYNCLNYDLPDYWISQNVSNLRHLLNLLQLSEL
jgi:hypothetical protein